MLFPCNLEVVRNPQLVTGDLGESGMPFAQSKRISRVASLRLPRLSGVPVDCSRQLCLDSQGLHFSWLLQPLERDCVCMWADSNLPASLLIAFGGILDLTLTDTMLLHVFVQTPPILGFQNHFAASFLKYIQTWQAKKCLDTFCWTLTMTQKVPHCEESHLPAFGPPSCERNWVRQASVPADKQ